MSHSVPWKGNKNPSLSLLFLSLHHQTQTKLKERKKEKHHTFPMFSLDCFFSHSPVRCTIKKQYRDVVKFRLGAPILTLIIIGHRLISHFQVIGMLPAQLIRYNSYSLLLGCGELAAESWPAKVCFRVVTSVSLCQFCI